VPFGLQGPPVGSYTYGDNGQPNGYNSNNAIGGWTGTSSPSADDSDEGDEGGDEGKSPDLF